MTQYTNSEDICPKCMELFEPNHYKILSSTCGHIFCKKCLNNMFCCITNIPICPLCNMDMPVWDYIISK